MEPRKLQRRDTFAWPDIKKLIWNNDLSDLNTFLVLNGGTGVGKTSSVMSKVRQQLEQKLHAPQSMLVVESRTATVQQINIIYNDIVETIHGIDVCQRITFMHKIMHNDINYDWIVIDECHGLFSEADFAEDAEFIANWIRSKRTKTHIIFVTANDEYFNELSNIYFPGNFNFIYLFPDFTRYVSHTYVKEIQFIKTNRTNEVITTLIQKLRGQKGIIFLKRASEVKEWFFKMLAYNLRVAMIVSQANETAAALTTEQTKQARNAAIDISDGQTGLTMADLCELYDTMRKRNGEEGIREAINKEHLPEDIDILLATDTIQQGISIKSPINYIVIEGYTEVEVCQKLGRFRGNLDLLYIIFNPNFARSQTLDKLAIFQQLIQYKNEGNQTALAEFYGTQKGMKFKTIFLKKVTNEAGISFYNINEPAYQNCKHNFNLYTRLVNDTENTVLQTYTYPLLTGAPKILNYNQEVRNFNFEQAVHAIADKWRGIPLKGTAQTDLVLDFQNANITDNSRHPIDSFRKCCIQFNNYNIQLKEKQANKKDLNDWPQYLSVLREKFKIIV